MLDFTKGLIPSIIVDSYTNEILMLAYMNQEAYKKTLETGETWFYSRSRQSLWNKGKTSGNKQLVKSIFVDCDKDSLLIYVDPLGPACHTGQKTCFYQKIKEFDKVPPKPIAKETIYEELMTEIINRKTVPAKNSYTNYLFEKGIDKIGKKIIEEAGEVVIAAKNCNYQEVVNECCDLFYHSFVLLAEQNIPLKEIEAELKQRFSKKGNSKGDRKEIAEW
ncbi:bifunctional phosphoribosyl-AMP cyclohydrolase/phosphoribosyl-ATP diphosphatase HisIE [Heyndrickxia sp. NPDC080065]|uniref:bifunctional phosphoribosyl-AMP cyclohydrolase/phosphoribosyl-ATP diphosphatase HisIE n=1 Tax=Heyndrickxia sp. NPDC080065 TaxID=3390568 RepID=UPI003D02B530